MMSDMLDKMEFEQQLEAMGDDLPQLVKFIARNQYDSSQIIAQNSRDIAQLKSRGRKELGGIGGAGAILGATVAGIIDFLLKRGG